jgi:hypothetical protein
LGLRAGRQAGRQHHDRGGEQKTFVARDVAHDVISEIPFAVARINAACFDVWRLRNYTIA